MQLKYKVLWGTCPLCKHTLLSIMSYEGGLIVSCENNGCKAGTLLQASYSAFGGYE